MKRRLLIVAVFLLAGAVVNVAVAWGCAALKPCSRSSWSSAEALAPKETGAVWGRFARPSMRSLRSTGDYDGVRQRDFGVTTIWIGNSFSHDQHGRVMAIPGLINGGASMHFIWMVEAGWPAHCLRRGWDWMPLDVAPRAVLQSGGVARPFDVIWPGFAINTAFYATILWLLGYSALALRRFIRRRRGLCPACAYPVGEAAVCSECGKALPGRVRETT